MSSQQDREDAARRRRIAEAETDFFEVRFVIPGQTPHYSMLDLEHLKHELDHQRKNKRLTREQRRIMTDALDWLTKVHQAAKYLSMPEEGAP